jgi:PAS domain S-box-containing protein
MRVSSSYRGGQMLESELFALLQRTTDAAFSVTKDGEIMSWNKAAEKLFGYSTAEAVHKTCYDILEGIGTLGTRVCHRHCSVAECARGSTEILNFDMNVKTSSGARLWVNMSTIGFDNQRTGRRLLVQVLVPLIFLGYMAQN